VSCADDFDEKKSQRKRPINQCYHSHFQYCPSKIIKMKVTFAIFFCVILGFATAKHLIDEEYKGFETAQDPSLARQEGTKNDDPEQMMRKKLFDLTVRL